MLTSATALFLALSSIAAARASVPGPTWSGGQAGVSLNATELEIHSVQSDSGAQRI